MNTPLLSLVAVVAALAAPPAAASDAGAPRFGGKPGQTAPNFTLEDLDERKWTLHDLKGATAVVLYFIGTECPLANRYLGRLNALSNLYLRKGVIVLAINPNGLTPVADIRKHARDYGVTVNVLLDREQRVADQFGVEVTPTVIVLDSTWRVRYRGLFDDNPTEGHVKKAYVRDVVAALAEGQMPAPTETEPWGCMVQRAEEARSADVTYHGQIAALLDRHCVACHRPGEAGPFSLVGYEAARRWARTAQKFTAARRMPPWHAEPAGRFHDERRLSDAEIALLARWADAGAPRGHGTPPPEPPAPAATWALGMPDLVLHTPTFDVPADGDDQFRCFVLPTGLTEDRVVRAVEVRPGNRQTVRHVDLFLDGSGAAEKLDAQDPGPGYRGTGTWPGFEPEARVAGWAPGRRPRPLPDGVGWRLRPPNRLVVQVHYHPTGRKETDQTRVALYFAGKPAPRPLRWLELASHRLDLPAGRADQRVTASLTVPEDLQCLAITPHMHYMGRAMKVTAEFPDGTRQTVLHCRDWDFHWQDTYDFQTPLSLPRGTTLLLEATYDTSLNNPGTPPDLPRIITAGKRAVDEMCVAWIACVPAE